MIEILLPGTDDAMAWGSDKRTFYDTNFAGGELIGLKNSRQVLASMPFVECLFH